MAQPIFALSLWQPWATLIAIKAKRFETRSWQTAYRGPLVIHAAKTWNRKLSFLIRHQEPFSSVLKAAGYPVVTSYPLPLGAALCVADLVECWPTEHVLRHMSDQERAFGDFTPGRFAWELRNVRPFPKPIRWGGAQGLWRWTGPLPETEV